MPEPQPATMERFRDRVRDFRRVPASELKPHPGNWRRHPEAQREAFAGLLAEVGFAGAILTRECEDGTLQIIDGHLRAEELTDSLVPVLVTDLSADEADILLASFDPISALATTDAEKLEGLLAGLRVRDDRVRALFRDLAAPIAQVKQAEEQREASERTAAATKPETPVIEMLIAVEDLPVIERALYATGAKTRGGALATLARQFLDANERGG